MCNADSWDHNLISWFHLPSQIPNQAKLQRPWSGPFRYLTNTQNLHSSKYNLILILLYFDLLEADKFRVIFKEL